LSRRLRKSGFCVLFLFFSAYASSAQAGAIDPVPMFKKLPVTPPDTASHLTADGPFFHPFPAPFYEDEDKIAAQTILLEAVGEGYRGMLAVGEVIRNRVELFSSDAASVCRMPQQFSCWNDRERARTFLEEHRDYYLIALMAWKDSEKSRLTREATDYHAQYVDPYWAADYSVSARIGNHIFYVRMPSEPDTDAFLKG
jgi:spore germination cell wall hydrolase CwlJ-like protein